MKIEINYNHSFSTEENIILKGMIGKTITKITGVEVLYDDGDTKSFISGYGICLDLLDFNNYSSRIYIKDKVYRDEFEIETNFIEINTDLPKKESFKVEFPLEGPFIIDSIEIYRYESEWPLDHSYIQYIYKSGLVKPDSIKKRFYLEDTLILKNPRGKKLLIYSDSELQTKVSTNMEFIEDELTKIHEKPPFKIGDKLHKLQYVID